MARGTYEWGEWGKFPFPVNPFTPRYVEYSPSVSECVHRVFPHSIEIGS
jgi:hypothetical protein